MAGGRKGDTAKRRMRGAASGRMPRMGPMGHMGLMWDALGISHISPISLIGPIRAMLPLVPVRRIAASPHRPLGHLSRL